METVEVLKILEELNSIKELIPNLPLGEKEAPSQSPELKDLFAALAKAQGEMEIAGLNSPNPYFKSRYADLAQVVKSSRPYLSKNGLSVIQQICINKDGQSVMHTKLCHSSGQWIETRMRITPPKNDIQTMGSYITYLRRYSYSALVGLVASDDDDDGEVAMAEARQTLAKGPSTKYNPKEETYETITKEQLQELEYELGEYDDLAEEIMDKLRVQSLADMPKSKFLPSIKRIRQIKQAREGK